MSVSDTLIFAYRMSTSMSRDNRCALPGIKFRRTYARTCFELTLICLVLARLIFSRKNAVSFDLSNYHHNCPGIAWIKCRQSGKCPVCGCRKLCKEYSRPSSKFSIFGDSALDWESKNLSRATYISANPPGRVTAVPSGSFLRKLS